MKVRISAPTRLHFGLLRVTMPFGGLGVMLEAPRVVVTVEDAPEWRFSGALAGRAKSFAELIAPKLDSTSRSVIADGPMEHTGLGVGTALGMAIAKALSIGQPLDPAQLSGRGERSRIGVRGFQEGGFHFDAGHTADSESKRFSLPANWHFALFQTPGGTHWHGERERIAFTRARPQSAAARTTAELVELEKHVIRPAMLKADFKSFAIALGEYNRKAGEPFTEDQGGAFANRAIEETLGILRENGFPGSGQSSWGPTLFAVVDSEDEVSRLSKFVTVSNVSRVCEYGALVQFL